MDRGSVASAFFASSAAVEQERGRAAVTLRLASGVEMQGNLLIAHTSKLRETLNNPERFAEFESPDGKLSYILKHQIASVTLFAMPRTDGLARKTRDAETFDAYQTLGVPRTAGPGEIRAAYWGKARLYHPDKIAGRDAPKEVVDYMNAQFVRINTAYEQLTGDKTGGAPPEA